MAGTTEKGFGTGLRAQLEKKQAEGSAPQHDVDDGVQPRSVSEAIAVVALHAEGVAELQAEPNAARAREQELRATLAAQQEVADLEQQTVQRTEQLDERMAQLASAEASVAARARAAAEQLAEAEALREAVAAQHASFTDAEKRAEARERKSSCGPRSSRRPKLRGRRKRPS